MPNRRAARSTALTAAATATVAASVLALVAGCGSSSGGGLTPSQSPTSATVTPSPTVTPTTAPTSVAPTSTAPTAPPTTPVEPAQFCRLSELSVTAGQGSGAAGTIYGTLLFRNTGSRTCQLQGYPGVAGLDAAGQQVTQAVRTTGTNGANGSVPVTLAPGSTASAAVSGSDVPVGASATACPTYPSLLVTPPGETHSTVVTLSLPGCSGLKIRPVVAGTTGT